MKLLEYCQELDMLSNQDSIQSLQETVINLETEAQKQEYLIKTVLATICDQNHKEGKSVTLSEKTAAGDPSYLVQVNKFLAANLAARIERAKLDNVQLRIKALHMLVSAEKALIGIQ